MQKLILVNACYVLPDSAIQALIGPLQKQIDRDFLPIWRPHGVEPVKVSFAGIDDIPSLDRDSWPIFINRHSADASALGWHDDDATQNINTYSRVFVGDCLRLGLNWETTVSHEALEMMLDPDVRRVFRMGDGRLAALEACDACEADDLAYEIDGHMMSDFVLPSYFARGTSHPWDFRGHLRGNVPALTPGGYMSIRDTDGVWSQIFANRADGMIGRRALMRGFRRQARGKWTASELVIFDPTGT